MYSIRVSIPGGQLEKIRRQLKEGANLDRYDKAVGKGIAQANRVLIKNTPKKKGFLRKAWAAGFRHLGPLKFLIENAMPYAVPIELGSKPHVILPRNKPFLAWKQARSQSIKTRKTSYGWVFARKVNHPGNRPYLMLKRTLPEYTQRITDALVETVKKAWS